MSSPQGKKVFTETRETDRVAGEQETQVTLTSARSFSQNSFQGESDLECKTGFYLHGKLDGFWQGKLQDGRTHWGAARGWRARSVWVENQLRWSHSRTVPSTHLQRGARSHSATPQ